jgi:hypothetical protein
MTDSPSPLAAIGDALAGVEAFAEGVGRRSRFWGVLALLAGPAVWAIMLRNWVFDSAGAFLAWLPLLVALLIPGPILLGFGRKARRLADLPDQVAEQVGDVARQARDDVAQGVAEIRASGLGGLRRLLASLRDLSRYGDAVGGIVAGLAGSIRMLHPLYLSLVALAALGAGAIVVLLVVVGAFWLI